MGGSSLFIWGHVDDPEVERGATASLRRADQRRGGTRQTTFTGDIGEPLPEGFKRYLESLPPREAFKLLNAREHAVAPMYSEPGAAIAARLQQPLVDDLVRFLRRQLAPPWPATRRVLEGYLAQQPPMCYVRRSDLISPVGCHRRSGEPTTWYLQLHFTGCSGLREVSAALASHWTALWFRANRDRLAAELLAPVAFSPQTEQCSLQASFVPVDGSGYARYLLFAEDEGERSPAAEDVDDVDFDMDLDAQTIPHLETGARFAVDRETLSRHDAIKFIASLDDRFAALMSDGQCRCQLCAPGFAASDG
ncbi:MAG: hypothetical protein JXR83_14935 [Deltaproteobacteria bacterium]|nr:hypothetical protein [Deltaproteobacteria bacterium]